jgi:hypothetical protein
VIGNCSLFLSFLWRVSCFQERRTNNLASTGGLTLLLEDHENGFFSIFQVRFALFPCVKLLLKLCGSVVVVVWKSSRGAYRCFERVFVSEVGAIIILLWLETDFPSQQQFFLVDSPVALRIITLWDYCWSSAGLLLSFEGVSRPVLIVPLRARVCFRRRSNNNFVIILLLQLETDLNLSDRLLFVDSPVAVCIVTLWDYC